MGIGESMPNNGGETSKNADDGQWGKEYRESVPPFKGGENQTAGRSESEGGDYYTDEAGVEQRDVEKIDISTDQGKYEWLDSVIANAVARLESEQEDIIYEEVPSGTDEGAREEALEHHDAYQDNKKSLAFVNRQARILRELDMNGEGGILGALERKRNAFANTKDDPNISDEAMITANENWEAVNGLHSILMSEMARRDPDYFGRDEIKTTLAADVETSEQRVAQTMVEGFVGEDGSIHKTPNGEKIPSTATEAAEDSLRDAKQDVETFDLLMDEYQEAHDYVVSHAISREDFSQTIGKFIENHTNQINQLILEARTLDKGSPEYSENEARRKQLARERSSAKRLSDRFFRGSRQEKGGE